MVDINRMMRGSVAIYCEVPKAVADDISCMLRTGAEEIETLRARVTRLEEALKRGIELHENCDADTCMCGDSMWHAPSGHKPTSMLQYYGDQWAEEAKSALEEK